MPNNFNINKIKIIIGLGNPGQAYKNTYHNVGFLFVEYLTANYFPQTTRLKLFKTENFYMNESGNYVQKILKKSKTEPQETLVAHDDADLELGKFKIQFNRNSAGHKGVESIIQKLDTKEFWRLRIGIRKSNNKSKAEIFVLKKITSADKKELEKTFDLLINNLSPKI